MLLAAGAPCLRELVTSTLGFAGTTVVAHVTLRSATIVLASLIVVGGVFYGWAKLQYAHRAEVQVAEQFVEYLRTGQLAPAFELTTKATTWGFSGDSFESFAPRQLCGAFRMKAVFPFQSNGSRLRRALNGHAPDMAEVTAQYEGECFFEVSLQRVGNGEWKVFRFGSRAG